MADANLKFRKHGMYLSPEYKLWVSMKQRCLNPKSPAYEDYGGRGITVCDRWKNSFAAFFEDMGARPRSMTLDRIDNDGNYEPSNCRWTTQGKQMLNTRVSKAKTAKLIDELRRRGYEVGRRQESN